MERGQDTRTVQLKNFAPHTTCLKLSTSRQLLMQRTTKDALIAVGIILALLFLLNTCDTIIRNRITGSDTTIVERKVVLPPDTVYVDRVQAKIVYRKLPVYDTLSDTTYLIDTVLQTKPFTAYMDTVVGCNKLKAEYRYPENTFNNINFVTCPDTVIARDTVIKSNMLNSDQAAAYATYGFIGGFILGILSK